jgi:tetratricopeptide (TPR) repeat protein
MQKITRLSLFFLFLQFVGYTLSQSSFSEFRALESRVKYINPDSLYRFSISIDTTLVLDKAIHHWAKGKSYFWNSDYPNAYAQLDQASQLIKELDNKSMLAEISLDLSSSLAIVDRNGRALSFALKARELLKDEGNKEQQTRAAISLGDIYRKIGQYEGALKMLRETLPKTNDLSYNKSRCLNRMAAVYSETGKYDSSLVFSQRALELAHAIGDLDLIATSENEIGYVLRQQNQFKESLVHFFKADSIWRSLGMFRFASNPMHHVSVVYRSINKFDLALD